MNSWKMEQERRDRETKTSGAFVKATRSELQPASAEGQGTSRRLAEQAAAAAVLESLEPSPRHA